MSNKTLTDFRRFFHPEKIKSFDLHCTSCKQIYFWLNITLYLQRNHNPLLMKKLFIFCYFRRGNTTRMLYNIYIYIITQNRKKSPKINSFIKALGLRTSVAGFLCSLKVQIAPKTSWICLISSHNKVVKS